MKDNTFTLHKICPLSYSSIVVNNELRTNSYSKAKHTKVLDIVITTALLIVTGIILITLTNRALDIGFSNQDIMLCNSAKVSGNTEYLNKCKCYYESKDISCIR